MRTRVLSFFSSNFVERNLEGLDPYVLCLFLFVLRVKKREGFESRHERVSLRDELVHALERAVREMGKNVWGVLPSRLGPLIQFD